MSCRRRTVSLLCRALLLATVVVSLPLAEGCTLDKETVEPECTLPDERRVADVHAHFFNGLDFSASFAWYQTPGGSFLRWVADQLARYKKRVHRQYELYSYLEADVLTEPFETSAGLRQGPDDYRRGQAHPKVVKSGVHFLEAALSARLSVVFTYFDFFPEVDLVTPLFLDSDGWAHLGGRRNDRSGKPRPLDVFLRHEVQTLIADAANRQYGLRVFPVAGFNPLRAIEPNCNSLKEDDDAEMCRDFWRELSYGKKFVQNFAKLIEASPGVSGGFVGAKIYPSLGYYPANNCELALARALAEGTSKPSSKKTNVTWSVFAETGYDAPSGHWNALLRTLPYAPLGQRFQWEGLPKPKEPSKCAVVHGHVTKERQRLQKQMRDPPTCGYKYPGWRRPKVKAYCKWAELEMRLRLAAELDRVMDEFWEKMAELEATVVVHASMVGAKLGAQFHKYGDADAWAHALKDNEVRRTSLLLAHAGSLPGVIEHDANPKKQQRAAARCKRGRRSQEKHRSDVEELVNKILDAPPEAPVRGYQKSTVSLSLKNRRLEACPPESQFGKFISLAEDNARVYLDFSNVHFGANPQAREKMTAWLADSKNQKGFRKVAFGTDFWMLVREGEPRTFLEAHDALLEAAGVKPTQRHRYYWGAAVEMFGLRPDDRNQARVCARYRGSDDIEIPEWLGCPEDGPSAPTR